MGEESNGEKEGEEGRGSDAVSQCHIIVSMDALPQVPLKGQHLECELGLFQ